MLNLESWQALGSRKGGVIQGPQGALKLQPPQPQQRQAGPPAAGSSHLDTLTSGDPSLHTCPAGPAR